MITGDQLKQVRTDAKLSQQALAILLWNKPDWARVVSDYEHNRRPLGLAFIQKWAKACNVKPTIVFQPIS